MVKIYGHRGLPSKAPENTLASFQKAASVSDLKWIELDVAITKDGQLVIIHDDYLDRTTDMVGEVTQLNYNEIKQASAGRWFGNEYEKEHLPTLKDIIDLANNTKINLNIELKGVSGPKGSLLSKSMVTQVSELLKSLDAQIEVLISSFNIYLLKLSESIMPQYQRALTFQGNAFGKDWRTLLNFCNSNIVNIEDTKVTQALVKEIKKSGYYVNVWTVNNQMRANQLANWGVDGIFTDKADALIHLQCL